MTTVPLPLRVRIPAYLTSAATALVGTPAVTYLAAEHRIDTPTTAFLGVLIAGIHLGADALALSHLTLPDDAGDQVGAAAAAEDLKKVHAEVAAVRASTAQVAKAVEKASTKGRAASKAKGV